MKKYTITCTEEQLNLIADAVEDWSRFLAGQCGMNHAAWTLEHPERCRQLQDTLEEKIPPIVVPDLPPHASYSWNGGSCKVEAQRRAIAMSYGIYRQILHFKACQRPKDKWNVYQGETLTCKEQGPLIQIQEIDVPDVEQ